MFSKMLVAAYFAISNEMKSVRISSQEVIVQIGNAEKAFNSLYESDEISQYQQKREEGSILNSSNQLQNKERHLQEVSIHTAKTYFLITY